MYKQNYNMLFQSKNLGFQQQKIFIQTIKSKNGIIQCSNLNEETQTSETIKAMNFFRRQFHKRKVNLDFNINNKRIQKAMKRSPKCVYGHSCYSACVNPNCTMPAFMCETGSKHFEECGNFHEKCQRIIWTDIENVINHNPRKRQEEFRLLEEKFDEMFYNLIRLVQDEHLKFKTWITTYGHNIEIMKFIKNINEENYKHIDGKNMDKLMMDLFGSDRTLIETPKIKDIDISQYFDRIKNPMQALSGLYLKLHSESGAKPSRDSYNTQNTTNNSNEGSTKLQKSSVKQLDSVIIQDLSKINYFFDNKIKSLKLLYRASDFYFNIKEFHNRCDNIPHTLTIMENQFGKVLGGYTPLVWNSAKKNWSPDKEQKTFIFSMELKEKYKLNLPQFAIANNPERGPIFGCCDLFISDNADKQKSGCEFPISFNNGKYVRRPQTSQIISGTAKSKFLVKEWQVFVVEFNQPY